MLRRLYFLFPDENHAQKLVDELANWNIPKSRIHAITRDDKIGGLPAATGRQKNDTAFHIEKILWSSNLILFGLALTMLVVSLFISEWLWLGMAIVVMLITFFIGQQFVMRLPDVHITEFTDALSHGEILLMVDVPLHRVIEIKGFIQHQYPEATEGGASWTMDAFGL